MKSIFTLFLLLLTTFVYSQNLNPYTVNEELQEEVAANPDGWHEVLIFFADHVDTPAMDEDFTARKLTMQQRTEELLSTLQAKATSVQAPYLQAFQNSDKIRNVQSFWITNLIYAEVKTDYLATLSHDPAFSSIEANSDLIPSTYTISNVALPPVPNNNEPGLRAIDADTMWRMGYTGYGTIAFCVDTGTDMFHPALTGGFHGNNAPISQAWFGTNFSDYPEDCDGHGTHVTGTMVGLDRSTNDTIGVAFNAEWTATPSIQCASGLVSVLGGFQWALNPDNNSSTIDDMPDVINNSWGNPGFTSCGGGLVNVMNTMEATKIAVVFAAGNDGPSTQTVFNPSNITTGLVNTFAVGAVQHSSDHSIAGFSSRGPSNCPGQGSLAIKPEVSAPGVNVRSSFPDGTYGSISGTSMASPHVSGAILLLREAFPETTGAELKMALYMTATDLGEEGEDNIYGMGIINVPAAFDYLVEQGLTPVPPTSKERDVIALNLEVSPIVCSDNFGFNISFENAGEEPLTELLISYNVGSVNGDFQWTGNLLPDEIATVYIEGASLNAGEYILEAILSSPNGLEDNRPLNNKIIRPVEINDETPLLTYAEGNLDAYCSESEVALRVEYQGIGNISTRWYEQLVGGSSIGSGNVFNVSNLTETQTFYAECKYLWPAGKTTLGSSNGIVETTEPGIRFDAFTDFRLKSVLVYFEDPGARLIHLETATGNLIDSKIVNVTGEGQTRVTLNFDISQGNNYRLKLQQGSPLLSNTEGAEFPYVLDDVVRLDRSLAANTDQSLAEYHCFYDWEIELPTSCGRLPVTVNIVDGDNIPSADFTSSLTEAVFLNGEAPVEFMNTSTDATSFIWNFGDGTNEDTNESPTHAFTEAGTYIVSLTVFNDDGCSDTQTTEIIVTEDVTSSNDNILAPLWDISLYPNPTQDNVTISFALPEAQSLTYRVIDIYGRTIVANSTQNIGTAQISLDMSDISAGIYYIVFENKQQQRMVRKLIKM
jgi:subtilisin family serine protease